MAKRCGKGADHQAAIERKGRGHADVQLAAAAHHQAGDRAHVVTDHHVRHPGDAGRQIQPVDQQAGGVADQQAALAALADAHGRQIAHDTIDLGRRVHRTLAGQHGVGAVGQRHGVGAQRDDAGLGCAARGCERSSGHAEKAHAVQMPE
jgi:hypothetical protein